MKIKRLGMLLVMACFIFSSVGIQAYAETVGEQLVQPESGWKRYDNTDPFIKYVGPWEYATGLANYHNGTIQWVHPDGSELVKFKFYGTKIRIISNENNSVSDGIRIKIDGVEEFYSGYSATELYYVLMYEKTELPLGYHEVEINVDMSVPPVVKYRALGIDAIDIDGELLDENAPNIPMNLTAIAGNSKVDLSWNAVSDADSYNIYRSTTPGDAYTTVAEAVYGANYTDTDVENGTTYYYVVCAVKDGATSPNSNGVSATPEGNSSGGNNALLRITMTNGAINEYDLSMNEVNSFIDWYDDLANGTGNAYYTIDKNYNIGPFTSRKDYIIFDKILQFEVMEYNK